MNTRYLAFFYASKVQGMTADVELEWLIDRAYTRNIIVEIGSWFGRSTLALALATPGYVIAIDTFTGNNSKSQNDVFNASERFQDDPDWLYKEFLSNTIDLIEQNKIKVIRSSSKEAINQLRDLAGTVDMVWLDGDHSKEWVRDDILNYLPLLCKGGLLCGHDMNAKRWPGVKIAVKELVPNFKHGAGSIWYTIV